MTITTIARALCAVLATAALLSASSTATTPASASAVGTASFTRLVRFTGFPELGTCGVGTLPSQSLPYDRAQRVPYAFPDECIVGSVTGTLPAVKFTCQAAPSDVGSFASYSSTTSCAGAASATGPLDGTCQRVPHWAYASAPDANVSATCVEVPTKAVVAVRSFANANCTGAVTLRTVFVRDECLLQYKADWNATHFILKTYNGAWCHSASRGADYIVATLTSLASPNHCILVAGQGTTIEFLGGVPGLDRGTNTTLAPTCRSSATRIGAHGRVAVAFGVVVAVALAWIA